MSNLNSPLEWRRSGGAQDRNGNAYATYRRPLGTAELHSYWDTVFNGVGITIGHVVLEVEPEIERALFAKENIELAWMRMKQRYPLLAASVDERPGSEDIEFVLDERSLYHIRPGEINLIDTLESADDVTRLTAFFQNGKPVLANEIIAKLWIGPQKDTPRTYHAFTVVAHYITDGITGAILQRELCQELSTLSKQERILGKPLEERLVALMPVEALSLSRKLSRSRRRWRTAAAKIIHDLRESRLKGGHTLPTVRPVDAGRPALSRTILLRLSAAQTEEVRKACRTHGITFGNALPVLSQLAFSRVLHRRYRGRSQRQPGISDEEWNDRRVQPMHFSGPVNLRPYLDRVWYDAGGATDVCMAVGSYNVVLPFMPAPNDVHQRLPNLNLFIRKPLTVARWLEGPRDIDVFLDDYASDSEEPYGLETELATIQNSCRSSSPRMNEDDAPSFASMLSHERFLARARTVRAQSTAFLRHPLLLELQEASAQDLYRRARELGLAWRNTQVIRRVGQNSDLNVPGSVRGRGQHAISNGGASMGNRDMLLPLEYPLQSSPSEKRPTRLHIRDSIVHMRCRPGELCLGALTSQGQLNFFAYADANVYDLDVVQEWMEDVRKATLHYLGSEDAWVTAGACKRGRVEDGGAYWKARL